MATQVTALCLQIIKATLLTGMATMFQKEIQNSIGAKWLMAQHPQLNGRVCMMRKKPCMYTIHRQVGFKTATPLRIQ